MTPISEEIPVRGESGPFKVIHVWEPGIELRATLVVDNVAAQVLRLVG